MRIEYFGDGSADCPLVLIYGDDPSGAVILSEALSELSNLEQKRIALNNLPSFSSLDGCQLFASVAEWDAGVKMIQAPNVLECFLRTSSWENIIGLLEPFCKVEKRSGTHFQYLDESGDIRLMISNERAW
jgi:hypothetical protein